MNGGLSPAATGALVLAIIAVVQGIFLLLLVVFVVVRRGYDRRQRAAFLAARAGIEAPMRAWLVAGASPEPVVAALRTLPRGTAVGFVSLLARRMIPAHNLAELAISLRGERWVADVIARSGSRFWWRRLEAARALALVAGERERPLVRKLLDDPHPAVQIAAASALPRVADVATLGHLFDRLPQLPKVVRHFLPSVLRATRTLGGPELARRIRESTTREMLAALIELASAIDDPEGIAAALGRADHPEAAVRRTVADALRRRPGPETVAVLRRLVGDSDATVRAAAARTLGEVAGPEAAPLLAPLLSDRAWMVRLRAAIALAQGGERGRALLRVAREGPDRFARDMAAMVSGLSDGALLELGDR